jgi:DNA mismatch endonuclease (patch repair protein)
MIYSLRLRKFGNALCLQQSIMSKEKRSKIMSAIRSKNTKPEIALRKALWANGIRYRIHFGKEKIDIAFPATKVAVFVDGCFWHSCPLHSHIPKSNIDYWLPKLRKNVERDKAKNARLRKEGWKVVRFWEHELDDMDKLVGIVRKELGRIE